MTLEPSPRSRRGPIIAGTVAVAAVITAVSAGTAIALGATPTATTTASPSTSASASASPSASASASASPSTSATPAAPASTQAADFVKARDAAEKAVGGTVTEISVVAAGGWKVEVLRSGGGTATEVKLGTDFSVTTTTDETESKTAPTGSLAGDAVTKAIEAAVAKAGTGTVTSVGLESSTTSGVYEVTITGTAKTEVILGSDFSVISSAAEGSGEKDGKTGTVETNDGPDTASTADPAS